MSTLLNVRWEDFEAAFIVGAPDSRYFLDTGSGHVDYTSFLDDESVRNRVLARTSQPGWLEIPRPTSADARAEIAAFIAAQPLEVRAGLEKGLAEKNPFMGFNKALGLQPEVRRAWADARLAAIRRRLFAFTSAHDLEIDDERFRALKPAA